MLQPILLILINTRSDKICKFVVIVLCLYVLVIRYCWLVIIYLAIDAESCCRKRRKFSIGASSGDQCLVSTFVTEGEMGHSLVFT